MTSKRLIITVALTALLLLAPATAQAGTAISTAPDLPSGSRAGSPVTVGETGVPGHVVFTQSFTGIDALATARLTLIRLSLACGPGPSPFNPDPDGPAVNSPDIPCSNPDPGVFGKLSATGTGSRNCTGITFTVTAKTAQGEVDLQPNFPVDLRNGESCEINFTYGVLALPTKDTFPSSPGTQTTSVSGVRSEILTDPGNPAGVGLKAAALGSGSAVLVQPAANAPTLKVAGECVQNVLKASVSGKGIEKVIYKLDGRKIKVVKKPPFKLNAPVNLKAGPHKLTAILIFNNKSRANEVLAKKFAHCKNPKFTG